MGFEIGTKISVFVNLPSAFVQTINHLRKDPQELQRVLDTYEGEPCCWMGKCSFQDLAIRFLGLVDGFWEIGKKDGEFVSFGDIPMEENDENFEQWEVAKIHYLGSYKGKESVGKNFTLRDFSLEYYLSGIRNLSKEIYKLTFDKEAPEGTEHCGVIKISVKSWMDE